MRRRRRKNGREKMHISEKGKKEKGREERRKKKRRGAEKMEIEGG